MFSTNLSRITHCCCLYSGEEKKDSLPRYHLYILNIQCNRSAAQFNWRDNKRMVEFSNWSAILNSVYKVLSALLKAKQLHQVMVYSDIK